MKNFQPTSLLLCFAILFFSCSSDSEGPTPEPDTIAPTVSFTIIGSSGGSEPVVVSDQIEINISAQDAGGIAKVEVFIDNQKVGEDTTAPFNIVVDLSGYASKDLSAKSQNYTLRVVATDTSGNTSSQEQPITIVSETPLITINFPEAYINSNLIEFYIFASTMDGELLGEKKVNPNDNSVMVGTVKDITDNETFMLTFAELTPYGAKFSTIANLTPQLLPEINLGSYPIFEPYPGINIFQAIGFNDTSGDELYIFGNRYMGVLDHTTYDNIRIDRSNCIDCNYPSPDSLYFVKRNSTTGDYKYLTTAWDIDSNDTISYDDFIDTGIEKREIQINSTLGKQIAFSNYRILGYFNESDFENNFYHHVDTGLTNSTMDNKITYHYNEIFQKYAFEITLDGYYTYRTSIPPSTITPLDWTLDYTYGDGKITVEKNSSGDILGKIKLGSQTVDEDYIPYSWELIYNSQQTDGIKIPELPEEIKSWDFYEAFSTQSLQIDQVEIKKYDNISEYDDYIRKVIADNKKAYLISNTIESIFIGSESNSHRAVDDWLID